MRHLALLLACLLSACAEARFDTIGPSDAAYTDAHPLFAEYCAVSQIKKLPGFGADIRGNIGGHAVFYLQGACKDPTVAYPVLRPCDSDGAGLSMNEHFSNAKWVATPGDAFFFEGGLPPGAPLTADSYRAVQRHAQELGIYKGVTFHDVVFKPMPPGWTREDWKYEMSVGTDYAISLGRARHCTRIPVDRPAMNRMIDFLNNEERALPGRQDLRVGPLSRQLHPSRPQRPGSRRALEPLADQPLVPCVRLRLPDPAQ